jgi:hypothetical protein
MGGLPPDADGIMNVGTAFDRVGWCNWPVSPDRKSQSNGSTGSAGLSVVVDVPECSRVVDSREDVVDPAEEPEPWSWDAAGEPCGDRTR